MAEIVILQRWREEPGRRSRIRIGKPAKKEGKVLLFTGVRYERFVDMPLRTPSQNPMIRAEPN